MQFRLVTATLGALTAVLGLCMATALPWSIYHGDGVHFELLFIVLASVAIGAATYRYFYQEDAEYGIRDGFAIVTLGWILAGLLGAMPYWATGVLPSFMDALFESVSGFTTTGASVIEDVEKLPGSILFWRSLTHWLGGMGIIVLSVAILPLLGVGGMAMFKAEVPSPVMDKLKPTVAETAKTLWKVYLLLTVVEVALLYVAGMDLFDSICHTFGTVATGGFSTKNLSIGHYQSVAIDIIIVFFMLVAGLNFTLHYQALLGKPQAYWKSFEFRLYIIVFVVSVAFVTLTVYANNYSNLGESLLKSAFQVSSIMTTTGYSNADWELWPWSCQWLLLSLMFMGGCAGSTGGGMKCLRMIVMGKHVLRELNLLIHPRAVIALKIDNKAIGNPIVNSIMAFVGLFVAVWGVSTLLLVVLGLDMITAVGASAATLGNVGPGLNGVGAVDTYGWISHPGKAILIFNMLAGRLELYPVFVLMTLDFWKK